MKHQNGVEICSRCAEKLKEADPALGGIFSWLKVIHPDAHISWTFRDQANQDQCFRSGTSKLQWPTSPHNALDLLGKPCSQAMDLFQLVDDTAKWDREWFKLIAQQMKDASLPVKWGGDFIHLGDYDHWQLT